MHYALHNALWGPQKAASSVGLQGPEKERGSRALEGQGHGAQGTRSQQSDHFGPFTLWSILVHFSLLGQKTWLGHPLLTGPPLFKGFPGPQRSWRFAEMDPWLGRWRLGLLECSDLADKQLTY